MDALQKVWAKKSQFLNEDICGHSNKKGSKLVGGVVCMVFYVLSRLETKYKNVL